MTFVSVSGCSRNAFQTSVRQVNLSATKSRRSFRLDLSHVTFETGRGMILKSWHIPVVGRYTDNYAVHFPICVPPQFCKDIEPGNARTKDCLEENRDQLSSGCKEEVDAMIERRVRDFRLDSRLRNVCENEIFNMCAYFGVSGSAACRDGKVIVYIAGSNW
jgi:hypothetical protein